MTRANETSAVPRATRRSIPLPLSAASSHRPAVSLTRRQFLQRSAAAGALTAAGWGIGTPVAPAAAADGAAPISSGPRPNILFLLSDDQRWNCAGFMGNALIRTPHLDRLAAHGVTFDNHFVTTSICCASRASILTGQYSSRHGIHDFSRSLDRAALAQTYLGRLRQAGYRTGFIGKWGVGTPPTHFLDYNRGFPGQGHYFVQRKGHRRHLTSIMGDQALEFLEGTAPGQPFCLAISFHACHVQDTYDLMADAFQFDPKYRDDYREGDIPLPATATPDQYAKLPDYLKNSEGRVRWAMRFAWPERTQTTLKGYYRLITGIDEQVGRIRSKLAERGVADNTLILYSSDNGFFLGDRGLAGKWFAYEESIRVPLTVYDPHLPLSQRGTRRVQMSLNLDLAPTMLDYAGLGPSARMQGQSLRPIIQRPDGPGRAEWFYEHHFQHPRIPKSIGVRATDWAYWRYPEIPGQPEFLFNLRLDPSECMNLSGDSAYAETLDHMRAHTNEWAKKVV